jgi:hypothetical protein
MNTAQDRYRTPQLRASDADRDAVVAALSEHFQAGRLTTEELEERTGHALTARTVGELDGLTADLPGLMHPGPAPAVTPRWLRYPVLVAVAIVLTMLVVIALVLGTGHGHHGWDAWWVIPVGLLIARRLGGRRGSLGGRRGSLGGRRGSLGDRPGLMDGGPGGRRSYRAP